MTDAFSDLPRGHFGAHIVTFSQHGPHYARAECSCGWKLSGPRREVYDAAAVHDLNNPPEEQDNERRP